MTLEDRLERLANRKPPGDAQEILAGARSRSQAERGSRSVAAGVAAAVITAVALVAGALMVLVEGGDEDGSVTAAGRDAVSDSVEGDWVLFAAVQDGEREPTANRASLTVVGDRVTGDDGCGNAFETRLEAGRVVAPGGGHTEVGCTDDQANNEAGSIWALLVREPDYQVTDGELRLFAADGDGLVYGRALPTDEPRCAEIERFAETLTDVGITYDSSASRSPADLAERADAVIGGRLTGGVTSAEVSVSDDHTSRSFVGYEVEVTRVVKDGPGVRAGGTTTMFVEYEPTLHRNIDYYADAVAPGAHVAVFAFQYEPLSELTASIEGFITACEGGPLLGRMGGEWVGPSTVNGVLNAVDPTAPPTTSGESAPNVDARCEGKAEAYGPGAEVIASFESTGEFDVICWVDGSVAKSPPQGAPFDRAVVGVRADGSATLIKAGYRSSMPPEPP